MGFFSASGRRRQNQIQDEILSEKHWFFKQSLIAQLYNGAQTLHPPIMLLAPHIQLFTQLLPFFGFFFFPCVIRIIRSRCDGRICTDGVCVSVIPAMQQRGGSPWRTYVHHNDGSYLQRDDRDKRSSQTSVHTRTRTHTHGHTHTHLDCGRGSVLSFSSSSDTSVSRTSGLDLFPYLQGNRQTDCVTKPQKQEQVVVVARVCLSVCLSGVESPAVCVCESERGGERYRERKGGAKGWRKREGELLQGLAAPAGVPTFGGFDRNYFLFFSPVCLLHRCIDTAWRLKVTHRKQTGGTQGCCFLTAPQTVRGQKRFRRDVMGSIVLLISETLFLL